MKRLLAAGLVPAVMLVSLAGCSGEQKVAQDAPSASSTSSPPSSPSDPDSPDNPDGPDGPDPDAPGAGTTYCKLLGTDLAGIFAGIRGPGDVDRAVGVVRRIADEAPPQVHEEWRTMSGALDELRSALVRAAALQKKAAEGKVDPERLQREAGKLQQDMEALNTPRNNQAGDAVAAHARDYCGLEIG